MGLPGPEKKVSRYLETFGYN